MKKTGILFLLLWMMSGVYAQEEVAPTRSLTVGIVDKKGRPMSNIVLQSPGTNQTGLTDRLGRFVFNGMTDDAAIIAILPKYGEATIPVAGMDTILVVLRSATRYEYADQNEKLVTIRKNKTTSNSVLDVPALVEKHGYRSLSELLKGQVSGLTISGSGATSIRGGANSFTANSEPLIVINGSPMNMTLSQVDATVNVYSIKSVEVQKSATEWGARGMNGAILINTR
jgi:hypothetical protein